MSDSERHEDNYKRWNVESLKEYFDLALYNLEQRVEQRFHAAKEAVDKAESAHERRLESMNEFRDQLKDQQQTFVDKEKYISDYENLIDKIREVKDAMEKIKNVKEGKTQVWAYVVSGISLIIAIISVTINALR